MTYKVKKAKVTVGKHDVDKQKVTTPAWKLMPAEMSTELDKIDTQVGKLLDRYTQRFRTAAAGEDDDTDSPNGMLIKGLYLVPQRHVEELLAALKEQHVAMKACVRKWASDTERLQTAIKAKLDNDELYELVKRNIPNLSELLASARIDVVSIPFGLAMNQLKKVGEASFLHEARTRTSEMVEQVTRQLIAGPREEFAEAVTNLRELIEADGSVSTKSVAPIRRAMEKLKLFDFVADRALLDQVANLDTTLTGLVPSEQNSITSTDNGLLEILRNTASVALDEAKIQEQFQVATSRVIKFRRPAPVS